MKQLIIVILSLSLLASVFSQQKVKRPRLDSETERQRHRESYDPVNPPEPQISSIEREVLEKVGSMVDTAPQDAYAILTDMLDSGTPLSPAFNHFLANLFYGNANYFQAETQFQAAIEKYPTFRRAWNGLGLAQYKQSNYEDAAASLTRSVELGASDSTTYGVLGYCLLQLGRLRSAETAYNYAILFEPDQTDWAEGIAQIYSETGRHEEAIGVFDDLIRKNPDRFDFWLLKANAWLELDEPLKTARCLEIARRLGELDAESYYLLGNIYLKRGLFDRAREVFLASARVGGAMDSFEVLQAARYLVLNDQFEFAREIFDLIGEESEAWAAREKEVYRFLKGDFAYAEGDFVAAEQSFLKALELDPFNGYMLLKLADIERQAGSLDEAIVYYDRAAVDPATKFDARLSKVMALIEGERYAYALRTVEEALVIKDDPRLKRLGAQLERIVEPSER